MKTTRYTGKDLLIAIGTGDIKKIEEVAREIQRNIENLPNYMYGDYIALIWHIDDVKSLDDSLSDDDAREILKTIEHKHDCEFGVTWEFIQYHIDGYKLEKEEREINE